MFLEYWPMPASEQDAIAPALNGLRRHVFSKTLTAAPWGDYPEAVIEPGDAVEAIRRIKGESQGDVVLWGSLSLGETFFKAGEVDVVRLVVMLVAQGSGRGVFPPDMEAKAMRFLGAAPYDQGLVELQYAL